MVQLYTYLVFLLASLSLGTAFDIVESRKLQVIKEQALITADIVRNIPLSNPQCKAQLPAMAGDFVDGFNYAINTINYAIPNIPNDDSSKKIAVLTSKVMSNYVHDIEQATPGDAENLKVVLVKTLGRIHDAAVYFENFTSPNDFINNQMKRKHDYLIFALYHLQYHALFCEKTNEELEHEVDVSVSEFTAALKALSASVDSNQDFETELRHALLHLSVVTSKGTYKTINWAEVNPDRIPELKIVGDVIEIMGDYYDRAIRSASIHNKAPYMRKHLMNIYQDAAKQGVRLADIKYPDNLDGVDLIRSALIDGLTIGKAYASNINKILAKSSKL